MKEFHHAPLGEIMCRAAGQYRRNIQRLEHTRMIMWAIINGYSKKRIRPQDVMTLPTDKRRTELIPVAEYELIKKLVDG